MATINWSWDKKTYQLKSGNDFLLIYPNLYGSASNPTLYPDAKSPAGEYHFEIDVTTSGGEIRYAAAFDQITPGRSRGVPPGYSYVFDVKSSSPKSIQISFGVNPGTEPFSVLVRYDQSLDRTIILANSQGRGNLYFRLPGDIYKLGRNDYISKVVSPNYPFTLNALVTCFLEGSMIETPRGEKAVETLRVGDDVYAYDVKTGRRTVKAVTWVGQGYGFASDSPHDDEAGWPVRIRKDAIADLAPHQDLLLTNEHCLFIDGGFIPVRMLVNGKSIFYDHSIRSYAYYHLALEEHAVIRANGVQTESFLDTHGARHLETLEPVNALISSSKSWEFDACAPLVTARRVVEPVFHRLDARARNLMPEDCDFLKEANDNADDRDRIIAKC
ncbi:hypothetical protein CGLAMM_02000 [Acetobacteraceae bacterium EV16G]|uniref:Hedgehog/Intein (Hint) domain-containing protein n=1 Tax=Sorlinia euscelidii TaxID=3081148 RepID=A0ABU7U1B7_9PROT